MCFLSYVWGIIVVASIHYIAFADTPRYFFFPNQYCKCIVLCQSFSDDHFATRAIAMPDRPAIVFNPMCNCIYTQHIRLESSVLGWAGISNFQCQIIYVKESFAYVLFCFFISLLHSAVYSQIFVGLISYKNILFESRLMLREPPDLHLNAHAETGETRGGLQYNQTQITRYILTHVFVCKIYSYEISQKHPRGANIPQTWWLGWLYDRICFFIISFQSKVVHRNVVIVIQRSIHKDLHHSFPRHSMSI